MPLIDMPPLLILLQLKQQYIKQGKFQYVKYVMDRNLWYLHVTNSYRVLLQVLWDDPVLYKCVFPRLGGMHFLMSFIGCIGTLMANSGLADVLKSAFGGVEKC